MTVIVQDDHLTAGAWAACGRTVENLNKLQRIVCRTKYGRFTTINISKYEHFTIYFT